MIEIDGSQGEGGGAILRTALALSTITGKPFRITRIRNGRPLPGLKREHLFCIRILQELCGAKCEDAHLGSESILFIPGAVKPKKLTYDLETAASATLVSQCLILATLFSGKRVSFSLTGGTDVKWSIPADYLANVVAPALKPIGDVTVRILRRGYYPRGNGLLEVTVKGHDRLEGSALPRLELLERGTLLAVEGVAFASLQLEEARVASRMKELAELSLATVGKPIIIREEYGEAANTGAGIVLWARCRHAVLGASCLGEQGVRAEKVAETAVRELTTLLADEAAVDEHLADQLVPYVAVCGGSFRTTRITEHLKSNVAVCEQFLGVAFVVDEETCLVACNGAAGRH